MVFFIFLDPRNMRKASEQRRHEEIAAELFSRKMMSRFLLKIILGSSMLIPPVGKE
jgi:hypothetical protein